MESSFERFLDDKRRRLSSTWALKLRRSPSEHWPAIKEHFQSFETLIEKPTRPTAKLLVLNEITSEILKSGDALTFVEARDCLERWAKELPTINPYREELHSQRSWITGKYVTRIDPEDRVKLREQLDQWLQELQAELFDHIERYEERFEHLDDSNRCFYSNRKCSGRPAKCCNIYRCDYHDYQHQNRTEHW